MKSQNVSFVFGSASTIQRSNSNSPNGSTQVVNPDRKGPLNKSQNDLQEGIRRDQALKDICIETAKSGNVDIALKILAEITNEFTEKFQKDIIFLISSYDLTEDQANQALNIVKNMTNIELKDDALMYICNIFAKIGMVDDALKIADMINSNLNKGGALSCICNNNLTSEQTDQILNILSKFDSDSDKYWALEKITDKFVRCGEIDKALNIADMLTDTNEISIGICSEVAKTGHVTKALEISAAIDRDDAKTLALRDICNVGLTKEQSDIAYDIAKTITDGRLKSEALCWVSIAIANTGDVNRAIAITDEIGQPYHQKSALSKIDEVKNAIKIQKQFRSYRKR